jgi:L-threonylcarbamoyladenylate synthase
VEPCCAGIAINGGRGGKQEAFDTGNNGGFEDIQSIGDIVAIVERRVAGGFNDRDGAGAMDDSTRAMQGENSIEPLPIGAIALLETRRRRHKGRKAGGKIVVDDDILAAIEQGERDVRADIAGAAGDEDHAFVLRMQGCSVKPKPMNDQPLIVPADASGVAQAAARLMAGGVAAVPTETVYGLAARAADARGVAAIYAAKARPSDNPLIVHVNDLAEAERLAVFDARARALAAAFWPGPLTLVLPLRKAAGLAEAITGGRDTVALRVPAHPVMRALIAAVGPVAAPSANRSGHISPTCAAHVAASLGGSAGLILDAGPCAAGLESTILHVDDAVRLLRPGAVSAERVRDVVGPLAGVPEAAGLVAPGMMASHYAPRQPVRLEARTADASEFHIGFGDVAGDLNLSATGSLDEAAAGLFAALHLAEASGRAAIAVAPVPEEGLGAAINDRLRRAAAERQ